MSKAIVGAAGEFTAAVASEVRAHLARRRMSGRELARRLGVSPQWVSQRLSGAVAPSTDDLERIAQALGMTPLELLASVPASSPVKGTIARYPRHERLTLATLPAASALTVRRKELALVA